MKYLMSLMLFVPLMSRPLAVAQQPYANPDLLVTTDWVAANTFRPNVRVIDMRMRGFEEAHIPGAVALANDAIRIPGKPPHFLPGPGEFESLMRRHGISNDTRVIVYDDRGGIYAARLWYVLNVFGHTNVALLDGGWTQWVKEGRQVASGPTDIKLGTFKATFNPGMVATAADLVAAIDKKGVKILDARTPAEIAGTDLRGIKRGGAVPSSVPLYWEDALNLPARTFRSRAEIEKLYAGVTANDDVIVYCQVGMRASHDAFTLALIGRTRVRVYYGSWEEWGNRDDLPIRK